jgi:hypothetical protein
MFTTIISSSALISSMKLLKLKLKFRKWFASWVDFWFGLVVITVLLCQSYAVGDFWFWGHDRIDHSAVFYGAMRAFDVAVVSGFSAGLVVRLMTR